MEETTIGEAFNLKSGRQLSKSKMIPGEHAVFGGNGISGYHNEYMFKSPKIVIGRVGAYCGNVQRTKPYSWITDNALYIDEKLHEYDNSYLEYLLRSLDLKQYSSQSGQPLISQGRIEDVKLPLPSLTEQKAIVAKLDRAQQLIDIDQEMLAKYDELIQSVFLEMFGDPVRNSKGWEVKKLGEVGTLARGKSKHRPRNDPSILGGKYPLIQTGDVSNAGLFISDYDSTYNEQGLKQSKLWDKGTLCITIAANIAKVGILDFDACFPDSVVGFKSEQASSIFIYSWMGFLQNIIEEQAPVSAQKNINLRILRDLDIIFPSLEMQKKFEAAVLCIHSERKKVTEMNSKSEELFSSLVQGAFG